MALVLTPEDWEVNSTEMASLNYSDLYNLNSTVAPGNGTTYKDTCDLFRFIFYVPVMGVICILGVIGNTVSFMVLRKDRSSPVAAFLLEVLSVADNVYLIIWMLNYTVRYCFMYFHISESELHPMWMYLRVYSFPILFIAQLETIWLTVVIAMNRFMAVCMPYKAPHLCNMINVYKEVIFVTAFSILYNMPRFFELTIHTVANQTKYNRTELGTNEYYTTVYVDALYYLFTFVLPLLILTFVNTRVTIAYQALRQRRRRMTSRRSENENNITLVMIIIVLIFMLCQAPARIAQLVWKYKYKNCHQYQFYVIHISNTLEALNSSINFVVYVVFRKRFRDILRDNYCMGPLAQRLRRDSQRYTTTEGLSLEEMKATSHPQSNSSQRSRSSQKNGSVVKAAVVVTVDTEPVTAPPVSAAVDEDTDSEHLLQQDEDKVSVSETNLHTDNITDQTTEVLV